MRNTLGILFSFAAVALLFVGCASNSAGNTSTSKGEPPFVIVRHQNTVVGSDVAPWVTLKTEDVEALPQYKDKYIFRFNGEEMTDLEDTKAATKKIDPLEKILPMAKQRIQTKYASAEVGDKGKVKTYFEAVLKGFGESKLTDFRQEKEFWLQIQYKNADGSLDADKIVYRYILLYSVPKDVLNGLLKKAFENQDAADKPKETDQQAARGLVKKVFDDGF